MIYDDQCRHWTPRTATNRGGICNAPVEVWWTDTKRGHGLAFMGYCRDHADDVPPHIGVARWRKLSEEETAIMLTFEE